jgi:uncharacterized protein (DUF58 family)
VGLFYQVQEEVLERLGRVGVAARHAVESILSGQHRSVHRGLSVEFAGHRPYIPGDDLRHLDWLVYARTDRYNVRVYEEETRLRATLVVDCSGSMAYGRAGRTKLDYARMLAAALGFLMLRQGDAVGLALVDHRVRELVPPGATMGHLLNLLERLENTPAGGETSLATVLDDLADRLRRRGLVVLISDTFDDAEGLSVALQHLRYRKQDVRVFQVLDPEEEAFSFGGMHEFIGMESEPRLKLDGDRVRAFYREALEKHCEQLAAGCHASSVALESCSTADDLAMVLVRALAGPAMSRRR